jgi:hypothetical protein
LRAGHGDGDARNAEALRVGHATRDGGGRLMRGGDNGNAGQRDQRCQQNDVAEAHQIYSPCGRASPRELGGKAGAFEASVNEAVKAGEEYLSYCEPGSAEYKAVEDNNNALKGSVSECWSVYNKYKKDFDDKMGEKSVAETTFKGYVDKAGKVGEIKKDLDAYRGTAQALEKLDRSWLDGYKQRIDAFSSACNDAISAGEACKQYLDTAGSDYKGIVDNEKNMKDSMSSYDENYRKMEATYRNLHPLEYLKR